MSGKQMYECQMCWGLFEFGWSDEEARQEQRDNFPGLAAAVVCDDCYREMMGIPLDRMTATEVLRRNRIASKDSPDRP